MLTNLSLGDKANLPAVAVELHKVPVNIFRNIQAKTPIKTQRIAVKSLAKMMRDQFQFRDRKEDAQLVTFATYRAGATSRGIADIEDDSAIKGDLDHGFDQASFEQGMAELDDSGAQVIAYQTYNSTPEAQRWRIFVFLDEPILPCDYRACWEGLNAIFGGHLDDNAKDCSRLNYWPSCPPGQTREFRTLNIEVA